MDFISASMAARQWNLELRSVQRYCRDGRIPGVVKTGREWQIPADAKRPSDKRRMSNPTPQYLPYLLVSGTFSVEAEDISAYISDPDIQMQFHAEISYLKGSMEEVMRYAVTVPSTSRTYLCACTIGSYAAVNAGSFQIFDTLFSRLKKVVVSYPDTTAGHLAEASLASIYISLSDLDDVPAWMARGDVSSLPALTRPWAFYQHAKYQRASEHYDKAYIIASTTHSLIEKTGTTTLCDIYLLMACASSAHFMGMEKEAEQYLLLALEPISRNCFITPLAETVTSYGSILNKCLQKKAPELYDPIIRQSKTNWYNWIRFHNHVAGDRVSTILTLQELYLARLLADGVTYSDAAERMDLSVGRIRNLASNIYSKLQIKGKAELKSFIMF